MSNLKFHQRRCDKCS